MAEDQGKFVAERRQSYSSSLSTSSAGEPLIVVEESALAELEEEEETQKSDSPPRCLDPESPSLNPYLLSPYRESRKHSLPTPQCTSGITASQKQDYYQYYGSSTGLNQWEMYSDDGKICPVWSANRI